MQSDYSDAGQSIHSDNGLASGRQANEWCELGSLARAVCSSNNSGFSCLFASMTFSLRTAQVIIPNGLATTKATILVTLLSIRPIWSVQPLDAAKHKCF